MLALYQLIDKILSKHTDLANTLTRAIDIFENKTEQPRVFVSLGVSQEKENDDKLLNSYNRLMQVLANNTALSNTPSNIEFIKRAKPQARDTVVATAKAERIRLYSLFSHNKSKEEEEANRLLYPDIVDYNALRARFSYVPLTNSEKNTALAREVLKKNNRRTFQKIWQ